MRPAREWENLDYFTMAHGHLVSELLQLEFLRYAPQPRQFPSHLHSFHQLDVALAGEFFVLLEDKRPVRCVRGAAMLLPPMARHGHRTRGGFTSAIFKFHVAPRYWSALGTVPRLLSLPNHAIQEARRAGEACRAQAPLAMQQASAALTLCLVAALRQRQRRLEIAAPDGFRQNLWRLMERVEFEPQGSWTVARLAAESGVSPDHFGRNFRHALGQSPHEYLLRVRMRAAASALSANANIAIKEVAAQAGYATVHAFTRAFKKTLGVAPGAWRRMRVEL